MERLALAPFENLSSNSSVNWAGGAVASVLAYNLAPAANVYARAVDSISGAFTAQASRMLEGYFYERDGRLVLVATLEDLGTSKTAGSYELSGQASEGMLPLLNQLAKRLDPAARQFGTANADAFRIYEQALTASDRQAALQGLEAATAADPHFAGGYLAQARLLAAEGEREQGLKLLQLAKAGSPDAIESAEIDYLAASIGGNLDGRTKALETLAKLTPADASRYQELAGLMLSSRQFADAAADYEAAARLDPNQAELWNQLGYAYAFALDAAGAHRALERYAETLAPANANAFDSLGEVDFFLGDFPAAEKNFLTAADKGPARHRDELMKAAEARLMTGDENGAGGIFRKYLELALPSERKGFIFEEAQWEFLTGRRKSAIARLEKMLPMLEGDQQSIAMSQLLLWELETGTATNAAEVVGKAEALARTPRAKMLSAICRALVAPPAGASGSRLADALALLFARKYAEAIAPLEAMYRDTNPTADGQIRTLLAWAEVDAGRISEARKLVETYPIPLSAGDPVFASLIFPRFLYLRGVVLQNEGKQAEAKKSYELFLKLAGDLPDIWGDEAGARRGVGAGG